MTINEDNEQPLSDTARESSSATPILRCENVCQPQEIIADYTLPHLPFGAMQVTHLCRKADGAHTVVVTGIDMQGHVVDQRSGMVDIETLQVSEDLKETLCAYMMHKLEEFSAHNSNSNDPNQLLEHQLN